MLARMPNHAAANRLSHTDFNTTQHQRPRSARSHERAQVARDDEVIVPGVVRDDRTAQCQRAWILPHIEDSPRSMLRRLSRRTPAHRRHRSKHTGKSLKREVDVSCDSRRTDRPRRDHCCTRPPPDCLRNPNWTMCRAILHIIEGKARHARLADIIRQSTDGATLYQLLAAREGWSAERRTRAAKT
jgi:hypothetical protein